MLFTQEEVETILAFAKGELMEGKSITNYSGEGTSVGKALFAGMSVKQLLIECNYALRQKDPDTYGIRTGYVRANMGGELAR